VIKRVASVISFVFVCLLMAAPAQAGFDWGGDCDSGSGCFSQSIAYAQTVEVGQVPADKRNVLIRLTSEEDVDIQLIDEATGDLVIHWPYGLLNGSSEECDYYRGVRYCYSGYNGEGGELGHEWIRVDGDTNRPLIMKAFGYRAGIALVEYSWEAIPTCREKGEGSFSERVNDFETPAF
jgi:hypothetical protein